MSTSLQSRDAAAQTVEDIFFDAPEDIFEDALEVQEDEEIRCIETHAYVWNPDKDHYPDCPSLRLQDEILSFNNLEPAPYDVDDPEYEIIRVIEDCLINLQYNYETKMRKLDSKFKDIMSLHDIAVNRPNDIWRKCTPEALEKGRKFYVRRLNEITRVQELMDREYLVEFTELKKDADEIMNKWHAKQSTLAAVPHKLGVEEHVRWRLLKQKQLEYIHDKTKDLVNEQANRIRDLEHALAVAQQAAAQQAPAAIPYVYQTTSGTSQQQFDEYSNRMYEQQVRQGIQNAVQNVAQPIALPVQSGNVAVPNGQQQVSAEEDSAQAQQSQDFQNQGIPGLVADSGEIHTSTVADGQQEAIGETNVPQSQQPQNSQHQENADRAANAENNENDTISNSRSEIIEEGEIVEAQQPVNFQQQEIPEPDTNLPLNQANSLIPNGQEEPIATGANVFQGQEHIDGNTQEVQQPAYHLPNPPVNVAVPVIPDQQVRQNSYVHYMEYEDDLGRMYALHSSDPVKRAWARKKLDLDFQKKQEDIVDEHMETGNHEAAMKKWAETVSAKLAEVSPSRRVTRHIIRDFSENEECDDEYGRKRTFGTYEEDDEREEKHSRKRVRPITRITRCTPTSSVVFEPTPDDSSDQEMWEEPATGYVGHDGVYYDVDGRAQSTQNGAGEGYNDYSVYDDGHSVRQNTPPPTQQQSPSPPSAPAARLRPYASRFTPTKRNGSIPTRLRRERMLRIQWSQNNRSTLK
ncbi:hypothetical protein EAE96_002867 [Botrytis aclada]|nr:hypothetical protein EAE96_002867 [Botrytis aclada]